MKKIIDRNGRLFGKISVIDIVVVLLVAVLAMAFYVKNHRLDASKSDGADETITVTMLAENLPVNAADALRVGDKVYDKERSSGGAIGVITDIEVLPAGTTEELTDGTFARLTNEDGRNVVLTIRCQGAVINGRYTINRVYELGANAKRSFYTPYVTYKAYVTGITAGDAG